MELYALEFINVSIGWHSHYRRSGFAILGTNTSFARQCDNLALQYLLSELYQVRFFFCVNYSIFSKKSCSVD